MAQPIIRRRSRIIGMLRCLTLLSGGALAAESGPGSTEGASGVPEVTSVPHELRETLELGPFYQKFLEVHGLPVLGSTNVSDAALREAAWILQRMMAHRPEILGVMATNRGRLVVMAHDEYTTDIPEQADMTPKVFWDRRARGLGGRLTSCAEENLLGYPNDPYSTENILIHEFAHAIMGVGMRSADPTFSRRLQDAYREALDAGLWKGTYAGSNPNEYWAEGAQSWFDNNRENDSVHNHVNTRAELKEYDPALAALCAEVFGDLAWRYHKPSERPASEREHLAGFDPATAPRFAWRRPAWSDRPRVLIHTDLGDIEVELYGRQAPVAVSNFLHYALEGYYRSGEFFGAVRLDDPSEGTTQAGYIEARGNPVDAGRFPPPTPLPDRRVHDILPGDGTLSLVRSQSGTARDGFAIQVGNVDGTLTNAHAAMDPRGFAAFGRVIQGMDVVRRIHDLPADGQRLLTPVRIQNAYRVE